MYISRFNGCAKPVRNKLTFFESMDVYECYSESYVKCFWSLCDQHKSIESIPQKHISRGIFFIHASNFTELQS